MQALPAQLCSKHLQEGKQSSCSATGDCVFFIRTLILTILFSVSIFFRIFCVLPALPEFRSSHQRRDTLPDQTDYNQCHNDGQKGRYTQIMGQRQTRNNNRSYWPEYETQGLFEELAMPSE
jgi:hypothetical protein